MNEPDEPGWWWNKAARPGAEWEPVRVTRTPHGTLEAQSVDQWGPTPLSEWSGAWGQWGGRCQEPTDMHEASCGCTDCVD